VRELFTAKLESGEDLGASLALNIDGEMVVEGVIAQVPAIMRPLRAFLSV
jgi:hypothetical protein